MRLRVSHRTTYAYKTPARSIIQILRLTPRNHDGLYVKSWRIDMDTDHTLRQSEDPFGNIVHTTHIAGPLTHLTVSVDGEVETFDTAGVMRGAVERFPTEIYLRDTPLTQTSAEMRDFSATIFGKGPRLDALHKLMGELSDRMAFDPAGAQAATAEEAFSRKRGVCQDFAHAFVACARHAGVPARYVSGYWLQDEDPTEQESAHGWAEAHVEGLGWIGFDAANCICPQETHVSIARGLDYLGAAPVRSAKSGGDGEELSVAIRVSQQQDQRQN